MPFCRKCGVELLPDDKFCPNCGATYTPATPRATATEVKEMPATSVAEPAKVAPSPQPAPQPVPQPAQAAPATPVAPAQGKHVFQGYVSIIVAIIGFGLFFIPIPVADRFWVLLFVMFVEAIAVSAASKATERGDKLGTYAMIIAAIVIIIAVIGVFVM